jgi:phosphoglycolate phosphatase-like HAD superfamily hydrolase
VATRVVLFDLDGTVLTFEGAPPGPGRTALERAMRELYALEGATQGMRVAGGTDRALARALLLRVGVVGDERAIDRLLESYLGHLRMVLETRKYRQVGDVSRAVVALRDRGAVVGIATGNVKSGAQLKLASAGLLSAFHLEHGGFGCDAEPREDIVRVAVERCAPRQETQVVVIGDTEHDVRAGRAVGARVVGVATDTPARLELEAAGADAIVDTCGDALVSEALR